MSSSGQPVTVGPIVLSGLEVPEIFERAGSMQPVVHRLIGGGRIVHLIGPNPCRRELCGMLTGAGAVDRAIALEALRDSGIPIPLLIGAWAEIVVVTALELDYAARGSIIRYRLLAEPIPPQPAWLGTTVSDVVSLAAADLGSANTAIGLSGLASLGGVSAALATSQAAIASTAASATPSFDPTTIAAPLSSAIGSAGQNLVSLGSGTDLVADASGLASASANAQTLAATVQAGGYVNRADGAIAALNGEAVSPLIHS